MTAPPLKASDDRRLSPLTGFTRDHWLEISERLLAGVLRHVDPATGLPDLPGDPEETALGDQLRNPGGVIEAFERTMILAATTLAATGRTTVPGADGDVAEIYRRGLARFIDPASPGYTPTRCGTGIVLAMLLAPEHFLDPLDAAARKRLGEHLARFVERRVNESNVMLFSMMPAPILDRLGTPYNRAILDNYFDRILSFYRGDGWFIDGWNRGFDAYNFWGFQFYLHAMMDFDAPWRRRYADRVREITRAHEQTLPYLFGRDGAPVPKGRSLNYRFAVVSGIGTAQRSGLASMAPGLARRIASGCLRYFWDHGCQSERGLLEPGYHGPNSAVGEDYTDRGAPYWAATGLVPLTLPPDHPFWTAEEQPIPADSPGVKRLAVPGARMTLKVDGDRGEALMITADEPFLHRSVWQAGTKYFQHAYSSSLGYALTGDLGPELAAGRTGISRDGHEWALRTWPRVVRLDPWSARSEWDAWAALEGLTGTVVTETAILDRGQIHVFWHTADEPRWLTIGGYAVRVEHGARAMMDVRHDGLDVSSDEMWSVMQSLSGGPGRFSMEEVRPRPGFSHAHLFGGWAAFPQWTTCEPVAPGAKVAVFVDAARRREAPEPHVPEFVIADGTGGKTVEVDGRVIRL